MPPAYTLVVLNGDLIQFSQGALDHGGAPTAARIRMLAAKAVLAEQDKREALAREGEKWRMEDGAVKVDTRIEEMVIRCVVFADTEVLGAAYARKGALPGREGLWRERVWVEWVKAFNDVTCFTDMIHHSDAEARAQEVLHTALRDPACTGIVFGGKHHEQHLAWTKETTSPGRVFLSFVADCGEKVLLEEPKVVQRNPFPGVFRRRPLNLEECRTRRTEVLEARQPERTESAAVVDKALGDDHNIAHRPSRSLSSQAMDRSIDTEETTNSLPGGIKQEDIHLDLPPEAVMQVGKETQRNDDTTASQQAHQGPRPSAMPPISINGPRPMIFDSNGNRVDERYATNGAVIGRITNMHPCNNHYLRGRCTYVGCRHEHNIPLNDEEMAALRYLGRRIKCRNGRSCQDEQCHAGHMCPNLSCDAGSCGFPLDWHDPTSLLARGQGWMVNKVERHRERIKPDSAAADLSHQPEFPYPPQPGPPTAVSATKDPRLRHRSGPPQRSSQSRPPSSSPPATLGKHSVQPKVVVRTEEQASEGNSDGQSTRGAKRRRLQAGREFKFVMPS